MRPRPRPELADLTPYKTSDAETGRIFLHANENPYPPPPDVVDEVFATARSLELNRYPPPPDELVREIASYAGVDPSWVCIGDGSNEVLLQTCLAFGGPGRTAMLFEPTYRMHHRQARMAGTDVIDAFREPDMEIDVLAACEAIDGAQPDIVFVCTPNNPTGTITPVDDLQRIVDAAPGLVVIDEAYHEFCDLTFVDRLERHENVLVVRTLSKAFRLASVRLGYGIGNPALLEEMRRVRMPYAQSAFTQVAATVALKRRDELLATVPELISERERVAASLAQGAEVFPSGANFILFR
ncbi:MAG: aminotransferase class I/II-fold pyridoxal phosphate-dependent enzyme, partial [Actinomycetota bacterium]